MSDLSESKIVKQQAIFTIEPSGNGFNLSVSISPHLVEKESLDYQQMTEQAKIMQTITNHVATAMIEASKEIKKATGKINHG